MLTTFDYFWLTFLFFCILDCFTRVFKRLLLVLKEYFLLLFSTFALFCMPEATSRLHKIHPPPPPLSYPQVIHKLSTGLSSSNATHCTGPKETWHDSCILEYPVDNFRIPVDNSWLAVDILWVKGAKGPSSNPKQPNSKLLLKVTQVTLW